MSASRPPSFICSTCMRSLQRTPHRTTRSLATRQPQSDPHLPRWRQTPPAMKQPIRLRPTPFKPWKVNDDQEALDQMYDRFLSRLEPGAGKRGRDMLPEDVKWLAITHKSHDHGRQGFNDKLAYLGTRLLNLQTSLALLRSPATSSPLRHSEVFQHPSLASIENVSPTMREVTLDRMRLARLASGKYGMDKVLRWKPKDPERLRESGEWTVLVHGLCAVVGAVAMHRGGDVAVKCVREKILGPLGL